MLSVLAADRPARQGGGALYRSTFAKTVEGSGWRRRDATRGFGGLFEGATPSSVEAEPKPPSAKVKRPWPTGQFMFIGGDEAIPGQVGIRRAYTGFVRCQFLLAALRMNTASGKFVCLTWCVCSERSNCSTVCRPRRFLGPQSRSDSSDSTTRHLDPCSMLETPLTSDTQDSSVLWMHHVLSRHRGFQATGPFFPVKGGASV